MDSESTWFLIETAQGNVSLYERSDMGATPP